MYVSYLLELFFEYYRVNFDDLLCLKKTTYVCNVRIVETHYRGRCPSNIAGGNLKICMSTKASSKINSK